MAYRDDDPFGGAGAPGGYTPRDPGSMSLYDAVAGIYQRALGRPGSAAEINEWIQGTGGDLAAIQQGIYGSPEAKAYNASLQQQPPAPTSGETPIAPSSPSVAGSAPGAMRSAETPAAAGSAAPSFTPPGYTPPPPFSYAAFVAPDPNALDQDPLYRDTLRREQDAIQRSAAARGVLNTGGTIDDLLRNAKDIAATGYANLFNRDLTTYRTNRENALDTYNTNYGTQFRDPYQYQYMGAQDVYNSRQHNYDLGQQYGWYRNLFDFDRDKFDWQKQQDLFNNKYRLLSL